MIIPGMVPTPLDNYRVIGSPGSFCGAKFFGELPLELETTTVSCVSYLWDIRKFLFSFFFFSHSTWREIVVISYRDLF